MAALNDEIRRFMVEALACYDSPKTVADAVKAEFGHVISRQAVESYDPTKTAGKGLSAKWRVVFEATREQYMKEAVGTVQIANKVHRLRALQRLLAQAERTRNIPVALQTLEQAAKEMGEAYVNRRPTEGAPAEPMPVGKVIIEVQHGPGAEA